MDFSKILPGTEECNSSESGWTTYIASPDKEYNHADDEDDEDGSIVHGYKKDAEDAESDDSMASDASTGPSDQGNLYGHLSRSRGFGHSWDRVERKYVAKNYNLQDEKKKYHEQIKDKKDNSWNRANVGGRLKKF